jgi:hypothetical protein
VLWLPLAAALISLAGLRPASAETEEQPPQTSTVAASTPSVTKPAPVKAAPAVQKVVAYKINPSTVRRIGPVAMVTEVSSGLPFPARVDTGATTCSIHYEEMKIDDPAESPKDNVGKPVHILIKNPDGQSQWIDSKIADHVVVRTSTNEDERYKVQLKLRWEDVEKKVLVTLNDREKMKYPVLLGRNFLRGDFLVDVNLDSEK